MKYQMLLTVSALSLALLSGCEKSEQKTAVESGPATEPAAAAPGAAPAESKPAAAATDASQGMQNPHTGINTEAEDKDETAADGGKETGSENEDVSDQEEAPVGASAPEANPGAGAAPTAPLTRETSKASAP